MGVCVSERERERETLGYTPNIWFFFRENYDQPQSFSRFSDKGTSIYSCCRIGRWMLKLLQVIIENQLKESHQNWWSNTLVQQWETKQMCLATIGRHLLYRKTLRYWQQTEKSFTLSNMHECHVQEHTQILWFIPGKQRMKYMELICC